MGLESQYENRDQFDSSKDPLNVDNKGFHILNVFKNNEIVTMYIKKVSMFLGLNFDKGLRSLCSFAYYMCSNF